MDNRVWIFLDSTQSKPEARRICTARRVSRARAACARVREEPRWSRRDGNRFSDSYHHEDILNFNQARFIFVLTFTGYGICRTTKSYHTNKEDLSLPAN